MGLDCGVQPGDGFVEPHSVKTAFFFVRYDAFEVFEGAGHACLTVAFHNGKVYKKVY